MGPPGPQRTNSDMQEAGPRPQLNVAHRGTLPRRRKVQRTQPQLSWGWLMLGIAMCTFGTASAFRPTTERPAGSPPLPLRHFPGDCGRQL
eukprot:4003516-Heterocapsa_arctica.AAC.1